MKVPYRREDGFDLRGQENIENAEAVLAVLEDLRSTWSNQTQWYDFTESAASHASGSKIEEDLRKVVIAMRALIAKGKAHHSESSVKKKARELRENAAKMVKQAEELEASL